STTGQKVAQRHRLPRMLELNAFLTQEQAGRIRFGPLARYVERRLVGAAPCVIVVSEPLRREVAELGVDPDWIVKMPMVVDLEKFSPGEDDGEIRRRHGLEDRFIIGYVGTLTAWHGLDLLSDVADRLRRQEAPPFAFLIVGGEEHKLEENRRRVRAEGLE